MMKRKLFPCLCMAAVLLTLVTAGRLERLRVQTSSVTQLRLGSGGDTAQEQDLHRLASGIVWVW